eukprot:3618547-Rhodomonas_salina.1
MESESETRRESIPFVPVSASEIPGADLENLLWAYMCSHHDCVALYCKEAQTRGAPARCGTTLPVTTPTRRRLELNRSVSSSQRLAPSCPFPVLRSRSTRHATVTLVVTAPQHMVTWWSRPTANGHAAVTAGVTGA